VTKGVRRSSSVNGHRAGTISRAQIVEAALRSLRTAGFEQDDHPEPGRRSRRVPDVAHRYIRDKDDSMDEVAEELLIQSKPMPRPGDVAGPG